VAAAGDCSDDHFGQGEVDAAHVARSYDTVICSYDCSVYREK